MSILLAPKLDPALQAGPRITEFTMSRKSERQEAILSLIATHAIPSQEDLKRLLGELGWIVTQATLSRDLRDLGVVRAPTETGARYLLPEMVGDDGKLSLDSILPQWFSKIDGVGELIVLGTLPGGAQPISEAIDSEGWPDVLGTIAGENTILIVCRSAAARAAVTDRISQLANPE
jgi:transcriptional regulator of arginine metabolism